VKQFIEVGPRPLAPIHLSPLRRRHHPPCVHKACTVRRSGPCDAAGLQLPDQSTAPIDDSPDNIQQERTNGDRAHNPSENGSCQDREAGTVLKEQLRVGGWRSLQQKIEIATVAHRQDMLLENCAVAPLIVCDGLLSRLTPRGQVLVGNMKLDPTSGHVDFDVVAIHYGAPRGTATTPRAPSVTEWRAMKIAAGGNSEVPAYMVLGANGIARREKIDERRIREAAPRTNRRIGHHG
jgi:hypothetical protein